MQPRKRGDTRPEEAILQTNRQAVDLTGAVVRFHLTPAPGVPGAPVNALAQIVQSVRLDGTIKDKGRVRWSPTPVQVDIVGPCRAEWEVTWGDGTIETFPDEGYEDIEFVQDLA